ncbi:MAG TPA: hypothetical protein VF474_14920 [Phenylobacterium sp.]
MADLEILYDPISINSGPVTVALQGLNDIKFAASLATPQPLKADTTVALSVPQPVKTDATLALSTPQPLKTDNKFTLSIPDPIRTETTAAIDLQPVVLDQCLRLSLGPLPPTRVCLPNRQRVGLTIFGVEVLGFTLDGQMEMTVAPLHMPPQTVSLPQPRDGPPPGPAQPALHIRLGS